MQHTLNSLPPCASDLQDHSSTFNILIAYEDFETGKRAKQTYDLLVENVGKDCGFTNQIWKFDVLSIPKLREVAGQDAKMSDIIIISSHGRHLPLQVKAWIESWADDVTRPMAFVALFDEPDNEAAEQVNAYLADVAKRAKMEFFAQSDQWPDRGGISNHLGPERGSKSFPKNLSTFAGIIESDANDTHWGINE